MDSTSKSCKCRGGLYCVTGLPNGISCTNGQNTEGKFVHTFPHKEKDRKRHLAWVRFVRRHRPKWSSTNSSFLCSDHSDENFYEESGSRCQTWNEKEAKARCCWLIYCWQTQQIPLISHWQIELKDRWDLPVFVFRPCSSSNN